MVNNFFAYSCPIVNVNMQLQLLRFPENILPVKKEIPGSIINVVVLFPNKEVEDFSEIQIGSFVCLTFIFFQ